MAKPKMKLKDLFENREPVKMIKFKIGDLWDPSIEDGWRVMHVRDEKNRRYGSHDVLHLRLGGFVGTWINIDVTKEREVRLWMWPTPEGADFAPEGLPWTSSMYIDVKNVRVGTPKGGPMFMTTTRSCRFCEFSISADIPKEVPMGSTVNVEEAIHQVVKDHIAQAHAGETPPPILPECEACLDDKPEGILHAYPTVQHPEEQSGLRKIFVDEYYSQADIDRIEKLNKDK